MRIYVVSFFFSSRRRHTRWPRDWSSDVCSSDLGDTTINLDAREANEISAEVPKQTTPSHQRLGFLRSLEGIGVELNYILRSEERRVGKECRSQWRRCM